jgi:hypothetical protein
VLGDWPIFQLTEGAGDGSCVLLSGVVAVLGCCIVAGHILRGMTRVRAGQAPVGSTYKPTVFGGADQRLAHEPTAVRSGTGTWQTDREVHGVVCEVRCCWDQPRLTRRVACNDWPRRWMRPGIHEHHDGTMSDSESASSMARPEHGQRQRIPQRDHSIRLRQHPSRSRHKTQANKIRRRRLRIPPGVSRPSWSLARTAAATRLPISYNRSVYKPRSRSDRKLLVTPRRNS